MARRNAAKIVGLLLGTAGGIPGIAFGLLIGALLDQVRNPRLPDVVRFLSDPSSVRGRLDRPRIATTALLVAASSIGGTAVRRLDAVFDEAERRWPPASDRERRRLRRDVHGITGYRSIIRPDRMAALLSGAVPAGDLRGILAAILRVTAADEHGIGAGERRFAARIAESWGVPHGEMLALEREVGGLDKDALRILGVRDGAGRDEIRSVYRELARHFHPDTAGTLDESQQYKIVGAFRQVKDAYDRLVRQLDDRERTWSGT